MAITQAMCTSFKKALLDGEMDFSSNTTQTYKIALFTSSATLGASTTAYSTTNEVSGTGYTAGGASLTVVAPTTSGTTAFLDFSNVTFSNATITARGALIYSDSAAGDPAVAVLDFGSDKTSTSGDFTIQFPAAGASTAIIRIA
jgi:hypothetical protein